MMKDNRRIKYTNADGMSVTFGSDFSPFVLNNCDGIYLMDSNVITSENTMTDGATYQGSNVRMRNIVMTISMKEDHKKNREKLYQLFKPKSKGTFVYIEDEDEKQIGCYVESINIGSTKNCRAAVISLICPDPYFESTDDIVVEIANWQSGFEFEFELTSNGIEFGSKSQSKSNTIENDFADYTGVEIEITSSGTVMHPTIYHAESGEFIKAGVSLDGSRKLVITTHTNNKHAYLFIGGNSREVNSSLDINSEFIQLRNGKNTFSFSAESGEEYMNVAIRYRRRFLGV